MPFMYYFSHIAIRTNELMGDSEKNATRIVMVTHFELIDENYSINKRHIMHRIIVCNNETDVEDHPCVKTMQVSVEL